MKKSQQEYATRQDGLIKDYFEGIQKGMEIGFKQGHDEALDVLIKDAWETDQKDLSSFKTVQEVLEHYKRMVEFNYDINHRGK